MTFPVGTEVVVTNAENGYHGQIGEVVHVDGTHEKRHHVQFEDGGVYWFDAWELGEIPE